MAAGHICSMCLLHAASVCHPPAPALHFWLKLARLAPSVLRASCARALGVLGLLRSPRSHCDPPPRGSYFFVVTHVPQQQAS